jgi:hypothetical protein
MTNIEKLQKALELIESCDLPQYELTKIRIEQDIEMLIRWLDPERGREARENYNKTIMEHKL